MRNKETRNKHLTLRYIVLRKTKKQPEAVDILASRYGLEYQTILALVIKTKKKWRINK